MTITKIKKSSGKGSYSGGKRSYTVEYLVTFTGTFSEATLLAAGGTAIGGVTLPSDAQAHPNDADTFVSGITADIEGESPATGTTGNPALAKYVATYTMPDATTAGVHPLDRDPEIEWRGQAKLKSMQVDLDGALVENSAGDLYDPVPEAPGYGGSLTITRNQADNPSDDVVYFSNSVCSAAWNGVPAPKCFMGEIGATKQSEVYAGATITYWKVIYPIVIDDDGWRYLPIDNGWEHIDDDGKKRAATDDYATRSATQILLDGAGGKLASGGSPVIYPTGGYKIIYEADWTSLALPDPFA